MNAVQAIVRFIFRSAGAGLAMAVPALTLALRPLIAHYLVCRAVGKRTAIGAGGPE